MERDVPEPTVFVDCTRCAAEGCSDHGVWTPLDEADQVTSDEVHRGRVVTLEPGVDLHVDCLAILEVRHLPATAPMSIEAAERWAEIYDEVGTELGGAFCAWIEAGVHVVDGDGMPSVADFEERFARRFRFPALRLGPPDPARGRGLISSRRRSATSRRREVSLRPLFLGRG